MTLNPGNNPFALFTGLDGRPLNGGKVYIGVAGQDPETNPQPIFWDADGNVPAANPMETQAGYIWNSGTPARFWTQDNAYSIRVRDRLGRQVFYDRDVTSELPAGSVVMQDGGTVQDALAVAANPVELIASTDTYPAGSTIQTADGHRYRVADSGATDAHVTTAGGVKLYVEDPVMTPDALGAPVDGEGDDAPYVERAWQLAKHVQLMSGKKYRWASVIGIPDQNLYAPESYKLTGWGATVVMDGAAAGDSFLTSASAKLAPDSTENLFTGKVDIIGINWNQVSPSVIINGDRLYNVNFTFNTCHAITSVAKSYRAKGNELNGYLQSLYLAYNHFSNITKIIDAKRSYNFRWDHNFAEGCTAGIYIDGPDDAAVMGFSMIGGLFEGGGLAVRLGKSYGVAISGVYFESNTGGDVATEKAYIVIGQPNHARGGGNSIRGCNFTVPASQRDDVDFICIKEKYNSTSSSIAGLSVRDCFTTTPRLFEVGKVLNQGGNTIAPTTTLGRLNSRAPVSPADARKTYWAANDQRPVATNNAGGVFTVAAINVQDVIGLPRISGERDACGTIYIRMAHLTAAGGVEFGAALAVIDFVAMGSSNSISNSQSPVNDVYLAFTLRSFTQIPAGLPIESAFGSTTKAFFTSPVLTVERAGNVYNLKLSGYTNQSIPNWGSSTLMVSSVTMETNALSAYNTRGLGANLLTPVGEAAVY